MTIFNWSDFLREWSQEIVESKQKQKSEASEGTVSKHAIAQSTVKEYWLGYSGATEEQILAAETRLGITLPPSYREFLKTSNGWRETTPFINHLCSTEEISWFPNSHPDWLRQWGKRYRQKISLESNGSNRQSSVSDEDYFIYGNKQDCRHVRVEYLEAALAISEVNDDAVYLLNSDVVTEDGEWEAWFLADWLAGADRYPSFQKLMQAEHLTSLEIRGTSSF